MMAGGHVLYKRNYGHSAWPTRAWEFGLDYVKIPLSHYLPGCHPFYQCGALGEPHNYQLA